jgi:hypothetical protein
VEMVRMFRLAKASATTSRTQAINQLRAVLVCADPRLRESLSGLGNPALIRRCAGLPAGAPSDAGLPAGAPSDVATAAAYPLALLARRILELTDQINDLKRRISQVLAVHAPQLLDRNGVGPDTAAALLITARGQPGPAAQRRVLRRAVRGQPGRGVLRQDPTPPAGPWWGPAGELRSAHDRVVAAALGSAHPRLRRPAHRRGQDPARSDPLPETLCGPGDLPAHPAAPRAHYADIGGLTSIGASPVCRLSCKDLGPRKSRSGGDVRLLRGFSLTTRDDER